MLRLGTFGGLTLSRGGENLTGLHARRRQVGAGALFTGRKRLRLSRDVTRTDVGELLDALERGALEEVVELPAGPFLDGFFIKDAPDRTSA